MNEPKLGKKGRRFYHPEQLNLFGKIKHIDKVEKALLIEYAQIIYRADKLKDVSEVSVNDKRRAELHSEIFQQTGIQFYKTNREQAEQEFECQLGSFLVQELKKLKESDGDADIPTVQ